MDFEQIELAFVETRKLDTEHRATLGDEAQGRALRRALAGQELARITDSFTQWRSPCQTIQQSGTTQITHHLHNVAG